MPEQAIVCEEAITSSFGSEALTAGAPPHDWLFLTGGAIGIGLPLSVGAAMACPDRRVIAMQADGSAMYTVQALWTQAREQLDVVTVLFNNGAYRILQGELQRVGADTAAVKAPSLMNLDNPTIDWVQMAQSMGVAASRAETADSFNHQLQAALEKSGPHLIEVRV
jgi:acetolactate synthase-1/2/3 large subunit